VGKVLSISAVVLVLLVGMYLVASNVGDATPMLLNPSEPLLDEGVAMVMVCGKQPTRETVNMTVEAVVRPMWAGERWTYRHRRGDCVVYYHHPRNGD
jgi:hypothetical protein